MCKSHAWSTGAYVSNSAQAKVHGAAAAGVDATNRAAVNGHGAYMEYMHMQSQAQNHYKGLQRWAWWDRSAQRLQADPQTASSAAPKSLPVEYHLCKT
jgi:hypothetical protein